MEIEFNLLTITLLGLMAQGLMASVILALKRENRSANFYLSLLILFLSLWLGDAFFRVSGVYGQNPNFYFLPIYLSLGFGPLIYFYTRHLTNEGLKFGYRQLVHFIPVILQFLFYVFLQSQDYTFRRDYWFDTHKPYVYDLELILSFTSLFVYLVACRKQMWIYRQKIENNFSNVYRITLRWLRALHSVLALLAVLWSLEAIARLIWDYYPVTPFSSISVGLTILFIGIGAILQKDLRPVTAQFQKRGATETPPEETFIDPIKVERIQSLMKEEELFLKQELTLEEFASEVGLSRREASRAINLRLNMTFIDFVNQYRVQRFKELVDSQKLAHLSLIGIAFESGFNSKSTFNRVFKKMEGISPSEYLKSTQNMS